MKTTKHENFSNETDNKEKEHTFFNKVKDTIKNDKETMFFIINLSFTLLIAIYSTIIVFRQDQKFQLELAKYQQNLAIENSYTNLSVDINYGTSFMYTCFPFISIKNTGQINANDVKVYIELKSIDESWKSYLHDISQFHVVAYNDLPFKISEAKKEYYSNQESIEENVLVLDIDHISPGMSKIFYVSPIMATPKVIGEKVVDLEIILNTDYEKFGEYLHNYFSIAKVAVSASCENCLVPIEHQNILDISYLDGCHYQVIDRNPLENGAERLIGQLTYKYLIPDKNFNLFKELPPIIVLK